jgi:hypothetical protein
MAVRHSSLVIPLSFVIRVSPLKKYRPPRPRDVKGGCSPQNILENWVLVAELGDGGNKILHELRRCPGDCASGRFDPACSH